MNLLNRLSTNILTILNYLHKDFIGFNFDFSFIQIFFVSVFVSLVMIFVTFVVGKKICELIKFDNENKSYAYLIYTGIGYIFISSVMGVLGIYSLLSPLNISLFLLAIFIFATGFPFKIIPNAVFIFSSVRETLDILKPKKIIWVWITLFILLGIVNLINPEFREDQYHTDFARTYLSKQTILIPPKEDLRVSASPMLPEMYYAIGIFLYSKEVPRYLNFIFYLLSILTLIHFAKLKDYKFSIYLPLLFVSAPVVIKETSSGYTDFVWIFCILLSILILIDYKKTSTKYLLAGFFLGGMVAGKLWTIVIYPVFSLFVMYKTFTEKVRFKPILLFLLGFFGVTFLWFCRSFILTHNPLFPAFGYSLSAKNSLFDYFGLNYAIFDPTYFINVFSPLFFIGLFLFLINFKENFNNILKLDIFKLFLLVLFLYMFIHYPYGRYLLGLYIFFIFISSLGIYKFAEKFKYANIFVNIIVLFVFAYYCISSILVLPYSLGIANKNNYLSRVLVRDNSSYYDFGHNFNKYMDKKDLVGMYNFHGYYYADFNYIDTNYIFTYKNKSLDLLKKAGVTKLLIRSGDIKWFCGRLKISDCSRNKYRLISDYLVFPNYYLYSLK